MPGRHYGGAMLMRSALAAVVLSTSFGVVSLASPAHAEGREPAASDSRSSGSSLDLGVAARRATRSHAPVRLIVSADARRDVESLGVELAGRIGTLPQFRGLASADAVSKIIRAGLSHAVTVDAWVPKPRPVEVAAAEASAVSATDAAGIVGAAALRQAGNTGAGTAVAVLDDGIDASHPYFRRGDGTAIVAQGCFVTYLAEYPPQLPCAGNQSVVIGPDAANVGSDPAFTHGTHVAGIIAGDPTGVPAAQGTWGMAPGTGLVVGRVFGSGGAFTSDIVAGLDWVASIARQHNVVAVNLSLGLFLGSRVDCTPLADADYAPVVRRLTAAGVAVIAASGNDGSAMAQGMPACATNVVSVGATNADKSIADYSNIAPATDVVAPGTNLWSSTSGGGFAAFSGTSMATPVVAGSYALAHAARADLGNDSWLSLFKDSAIYVDDIVVQDLPLIQVDNTARIGSGISLPGRPTGISVKESGLSVVDVSWSPPSTGATPEDYVVTVGSRTVVTNETSVRLDRVYDSPAPVTVVGRVGGVPGLAGQGSAAFPIDSSLGSVVGGASWSWNVPTWSYCQPKTPGITLMYFGPQGAKLRTLRVTNGDAVQVVSESAVVGDPLGDRSILITDRSLWMDSSSVVQVVGAGGALGPRWSLGSLIADAEKYSPPPPQPSKVRAASKKRSLALSWAGNGASAWEVYLDGKSVMTVTSAKASVAAKPGKHTVGVCALDDSGSQVRGSVLVTAKGQALK